MIERPKQRLFVAVELPRDARASIEQATASLRSLEDLRWTPTASLHLTLAFLGWIEPSRIRIVERALADMSTRVEPFPARLGRVGRFPDRGAARIVWIGVDDGGSLATLADEVRTSLADVVELEARPFRAHVTVPRASRPVGLALPQAAVTARAFPIDAMTLFRSHLGGTSARYEA